LRAVVGFTDESGHRFGRLLRPGFRHCFVAIDDGLYWILLDAREPVPTVKTLASSDFDLLAFWRDKGYCAIEVTRAGRGIRGPLVAANCVGLTKAVLGIRAPLCVTPRQLYNRLRRGT